MNQLLEALAPTISVTVCRVCGKLGERSARLIAGKDDDLYNFARCGGHVTMAGRNDAKGQLGDFEVLNANAWHETHKQRLGLKAAARKDERGQVGGFFVFERSNERVVMYLGTYEEAVRRAEASGWNLTGRERPNPPRGYGRRKAE